MNAASQGTVRLSEREALYLRNTAFLPDLLANIIASATLGDDRELTISVSHAILEKFREVFTEHLARVGFDTKYEPTSEGKLLEGLIDRFYVK